MVSLFGHLNSLRFPGAGMIWCVDIRTASTVTFIPQTPNGSTMQFSFILLLFTLFSLATGRHILPTFQPCLHLTSPSPGHPSTTRPYSRRARSRGGEIPTDVHSGSLGSPDLSFVLVVASWPGAVCHRGGPKSRSAGRCQLAVKLALEGRLWPVNGF